MQIIRLEHPSNGYGIFYNREVTDTQLNPCIIDAYRGRHWSMDDASRITGFMSGQHYCAYKSIDELQRWLEPSELKELIKIGFVVYLIDVDDFIIHRDQVVYKKEDILEIKDISELFNK